MAIIGQFWRLLAKINIPIISEVTSSYLVNSHLKKLSEHEGRYGQDRDGRGGKGRRERGLAGTRSSEGYIYSHIMILESAKARPIETCRG